MIALFLNSILVLSLVQAHYAPHVSRDMPWFEGWYTRITTDTTSIGFIVGQYNPMNNASLKETLVSILYQAEGSKKLRTFTIHPTKIQYTRFMNRQNFEVLIPKVGKWIVRDAIHTIDLKFNVGTSLIQFNATMNERNRFGWGFGSSPEGIAAYFPLGLHWYIHSTASPTSFKFQIDDQSIQSSGFAHMEKNWGKSFPESWVWVQALTPDKSVIIAGGPIKLGPLGIVGYVIGYRSGVQKYDFNPQSLSSTHVTHDACKGTLFIQSQNKFEKIVIIVRAPVESFELVMCPTEEGFKLTSEESFVGRMTVYFYKRHTILDSFQIAETSEFQRVGVEYGGSASCVNRKSLSK